MDDPHEPILYDASLLDVQFFVEDQIIAVTLARGELAFSAMNPAYVNGTALTKTICTIQKKFSSLEATILQADPIVNQQLHPFRDRCSYIIAVEKERDNFIAAALGIGEVCTLLGQIGQGKVVEDHYRRLDELGRKTKNICKHVHENITTLNVRYQQAPPTPASFFDLSVN